MADYTNYFNINKVAGDKLAKYKGSQVEMNSAGQMRTEGVDPKADEMDYYGAPDLYLVDGSDFLANDGLRIEFTHVPSGAPVSFKAFINAFNETYNSDWTEESVYGRADPIRMFKQTTRSITLSFMVPAASQYEGFENLARVQKLITFLYPSYSDVDNALSISQSPLVRMKLMNLITNDVSTVPATMASHMNPIVSQGRDGLLGAITNISVNHNLDSTDYGVFVPAAGVVLPKAIEISMDFKVIHEEHLGWETTNIGQGNVWDNAEPGEFSSNTFPYGADLDGSTPASAAQLKAAMTEGTVAYTQEILDQRTAEGRAQSLQAAQDIAKSHLLKPNGKLNMLGRRMKRRLAETGADAEDRSIFKRGIKDPKKAAYFAGALAAVGQNGGIDEAATGQTVEDAQGQAADAAKALDAEPWSWIK